MEGEEPNLPPAPPPLFTGSNFNRPIYPDSTTNSTTTSSSSSSSSPQAFLRNVQAAFKRHKALGCMASGVMLPNHIKPRRMNNPQQETPKGSTFATDSTTFKTMRNVEESLSQRLRECISEPKEIVSVAGETAEHALMTPSMEWGSTINTLERSPKHFGAHCDQPRSLAECRGNDTVASCIIGSEYAAAHEGPKKVHFATGDAKYQEMEWEGGNQTEVSAAGGHDLPHRNKLTEDVDELLQSKGGTSLLADLGVSDQLHKFSGFIQNDISQPITQSTVVGLSCATTTLINPGSAPVLNSTTYGSEPHQASNSRINLGATGDLEMNYQPLVEPAILPSDPLSKCNTDALSHQAPIAGKVGISSLETCLGVKNTFLSSEKEILIPKDSSTTCNPPMSINDNAATEVQKATESGPALSDVKAVDVKMESNKSGKQGKTVGGKAASVSRKKTYDSDLFFKVNGKLYQRLGKIGSGGSSEVHKVISSDCTIYALKKIKLKGRDYATAYGFCQEIEYLNKLKGKRNIIQLIDFEVTDRALLQEVIKGSMSNKDGRVKEDGYIYMVLEYGEIDLAHMLSQKWKELDSSNATLDENWLRFYWQQILLAVNTIHEERIVHSDLKPANFLLVRGSLKLIDFGIAKAIMSDTTNIQRDSQVGTLSYMSPEAFMCNEKDANGNIIKCGRPSDIWSLGCILYQMVYGRTPFSEYKTFWAKFKVITDPNHEIIYEPVPNPWLKDLMKKCLAWDRNERWRIPQLLQHPFLVPPIPPELSMPMDQRWKLLKLAAHLCKDDATTLSMCSQLDQLLDERGPLITTQASTSLLELQKLFRDVGNLCLQIDKHLGKSEGLL
ncbi:OLC1v1015405C3 [Oldenlandia corymbosa var. corymbosa]|uniref:OLC1v1015405C3 n=2 Tax=Oldenlandia corymbosa var. corymbosa TaxID=529605 RepID=A0AAV1E343_OLDCO|nr:OLC1v1015405C3 [Oldenlandia corymbosa var. corymbosa]